MFKCLSLTSLGISASINELIEPVLSNGFKGFELDLASFAAQAEREGLPAARRLIDSAKLKIGYFPLPFELEADADEYKAGLERLPKLAELAAQLGCTRCVATLAPANDERPIHQNFDFHRQRITAIAKVLETHGIQLGIGFCATADARADRSFEFIRSFDTLKMLLGMVVAKNVGLAVDLFELWACGSSFEAVRATNSKVVAIFLADVAAGTDPTTATQAARLLPGEAGTIDSAAALTALAEAGYDGPVTPKPHPDRFKGTARAAIFKTTAEKLDQAWKTAGLSPAGKLIPAKK
jgi:sugar phosphate isomerase/epimerase